MNIKAIIFDWGRTLFEVDEKREISGAIEILSYCKRKDYKICVASLARPLAGVSAEKRKVEIESSGLGQYFDMIETSEAKEKDEMLDRLVKELKLPRSEILIVDDRMVKSIKYGNKNGHPTVWFQNGPFANELPNSETGAPTFIIKELPELKNII